MAMRRFVLDGARLLSAVIKSRFLGKRLPFFVGWDVTFRCNSRCCYCGRPDAYPGEVGITEVPSILESLWALGTRWLVLSGGEPLLREDIAEIARMARERGFHVLLSTNGILLQRRQEILRWVDHITLSLDGPREINDALRGPGAFAQCMDAIECCRTHGTPVSTQCVLCVSNLDHIEELLRIAAEKRVSVMFQPARQWLNFSRTPNPSAPPVEAYRACIDRLIEWKRSGAPVRNSIPGLRHLGHWPDPTPLWCAVGKSVCGLSPDGALFTCHEAPQGHLQERPPVDGLLPQFEHLRLPQNCRQCWCAPVVEMALLFSLSPGAIWNTLRTQGKRIA